MNDLKMSEPNKEHGLYTQNKQLHAEIKKRALNIKSNFQLQVSGVFEYLLTGLGNPFKTDRFGVFMVSLRILESSFPLSSHIIVRLV
jgi:hypothetical protein